MMGALAEGTFEEKGYILGIIPEFLKRLEQRFHLKIVQNIFIQIQ